MPTAVNLSPTPIQRFVDSNGNALVGGLLFTYQAGTSTPYPTYTDSTGNTQNTNPIVLNQRGEASIWLDSTQSYKFVLAPATDTNPPTSPIWTQDDIQAGGSQTVGNMTDELGGDGHPGFLAGTDFTPGTTATLTLSRNYGSASNMWVAFDAGEQGAGTFSIGGTNNKTLTFTSPIPIGTTRVFVKGGTALTIGTPADGTVTDSSVASGTALYNRIANYYDVMDPRFGAKGDGVTDDYAAIQAAINYVGGLGGGVVHIPDKKFVVSAALNMAFANVELLGNSRYTNTITIPNNANSSNFSGNQGIVNINAANCSVREIGIDGNISNNTSNAIGGVMSNGGQSGTIIECNYIRNCIYSGVLLQNNSGTTPHAKFRIIDNRIENVGWDGIFVQMGNDGKIHGNSIVSTGQNGIRTDCIGVTNANGTTNVTVQGNYINKATPPTAVVGSFQEGGFMIVLGDVDEYISIVNNVCYDNRNAGQDGIGLGQNASFNSVGVLCQGNVVKYAGLFGIDSMANSIVIGNYIESSTGAGIKVGTDNGGNQTDLIIAHNTIINAGNATTKWPSPSAIAGIDITPGAAPALYLNHTVQGNIVADSRSGAAQLCQYGLKVGFNAGNFFYGNCDVSGNDFSNVAAAGIFPAGTGAPTNGEWRYSNNRLPTQSPLLSGNTPTVWGFDTCSVANSSGTNVTNFLGGFEGAELFVKFNDGNSTLKFTGTTSLARMDGVASDVTPTSGQVKVFRWHSNVWYMQ